MSGPAVFSISPAKTAGPSPVTLIMPSGYQAAASVTDSCGKPVPGATVTVSGLVATPHNLPAGTSYVDWTVSAAGPAPTSGARVHLVLASRQTIGKATTCAHDSPYGAREGHALTVTPAAPSSPVAVDAGIGTGLLLTASIAAVLVSRRRKRRVRGGHAR